MIFRVNDEFSYDEWYYRNATIYAMGDNSYGQCISTMQSNYNYPTIVQQIENTEDTGVFPWDENHLRPIDSTYVSQNYESTNYYGQNIKINYSNSSMSNNGYGENGYLKFDISSIPKERIISAKLHLYVMTDGDTRESTREIGVYDTCVNTWNGRTMTWDDGQASVRSLLGSFTVSADGHMFNEEDLGWREIDITEYLRDDCIDDELSLTLRMMSTQAHNVVIASGVYNDNFTFEDMHNNRFAPVLEIECVPKEEAIIERNVYTPSADTYISQNGSERNENFANSEFLGVNYTPDMTRSDYWGQEAYLSFDLSDVNSTDRKNIQSANLWLYVDETSDVRDSVRNLTVKGNDGIKYNADLINWTSGTLSGDYELGSFTVEGNGYSVETPGWKQINITEFLKSSNESNIEFILQMMPDIQHPVNIRSNEYNDESTRPRIVIDYNLIAPDIDIEFTEEDNYYLFKANKTTSYTIKGSDYIVYDDKSNPLNMVKSSFEMKENGEKRLIREYNLKKGEVYTIHEKNACIFSISETIKEGKLTKETINNINSINSFNVSDNTLFEFKAPHTGTYEMYTDGVYGSVYYYNENFESINVFVENGFGNSSWVLDENRVAFELNEGEKLYFRKKVIIAHSLQ